MKETIAILVIGVVLTQTKINVKKAGWILVVLGIAYLAAELYLTFA